MAKVIVMPKLGYTQDTGSIAEWLKHEGDTVKRESPCLTRIQTNRWLPWKQAVQVRC